MNPYKQENMIQVDMPQRKIIAEVICREISDSMRENGRIYERARRNERLYSQVTRWQAEGKVPTDPWYGAADYFVPLVEWVVDAVWGRAIKALFNKRPYMQATGVEASDSEKESGVTDFTDQVLCERVEIYSNFKFYIKQKIKLPFAVLKYCWVTEGDRKFEKANAITMMNPQTQEVQQVLESDMEQAAQMVAAGMAPQGQEEVIIEKPIEVYDDARLQYIAFEDYVWHHSAKRGYKPYWEGDRFWLTINEMTSNAAYDRDVVDKLRKNTVTNEMSISQAAVATRSKQFECFHWYGRLPLNKTLMVDFQDPEAIEHEVHCEVSYKEQELLSIEVWPYARIPKKDRVYIRGEFEETERFDGRSLVDKLYQTQKELNTFHNNIMNNAMLSMMKIFKKRRSLQGVEWNRPQIRPGIMLEVDMPTDLEVLEVGDVKAIAWELEQSLINFAERISNISVYQTGTARQGGGKTKGEVDRTVYEGNIGIDKFIESCYLDMKKIWQWTVDYYYHNMPEGLERRIRGENSQLIFPTQKNMGMFEQQGILPYWQQDDLAGQFDFKWENTSLNSSEAYQIQVANDLMERYLPQPMVSGSMLSTWDILRRGLMARKITDWQNILPPKEAIIKEMELMDQQAQIKSRGASDQAKDSNVKEKAVALAVQKGVPPEIAQQVLPGGKNAVQT